MSCLRVFPSLPLKKRVLPEVEGVVPATRLGVRPQPQTIPTGIPQVDALTGGLPRGCMTEIFGPASSGRSSLLLAALAQATAREEVCALIDVSDSFDPHSAQAAGVDLKRVLWVRCGKVPSSSFRVYRQKHASAEKRATRNEKFSRIDQALRALDLLLQAGGFGLVTMDMGDVLPQIARRVPLTSWFRFRRAVENTATVLLVLGQEACAKSCASLEIQHSAASIQQAGKTEAPTHARLLRGMEINIEVMNSRILQRKPVRSATSEFVARASWVG